MATTKLTALEQARKDVQNQEKWIEQCGGTRWGYIQNYGAADDPGKHGDGGEAIYEADTAELRKRVARRDRMRHPDFREPLRSA
jgi:hypothetical protein